MTAALLALLLSLAGDTTRVDTTALEGPSNPSQLGEPTLVELHVGHVASATTLAYESADHQLHLRLADVLRVVEVKHDARPSHVAGTIDGADAFEVDAQRLAVRKGRSIWRAKKNEIAYTDDGVVTSLETIERILGVDANYDRANAAVELRNVEHMPIVKRLKRLASHAALHKRDVRNAASALSASWLHLPSPSAVPTILLDYDGVVTRQDLPGRGEDTWAVSGGVWAAASAVGGQLRGRVTASNNIINIQDISWMRAWPDRSWATMFEVGDVGLRDVESRVVRGISLTNAPVRDRSVGEMVPVSGILANGWDVEAWSGGRLIDAVDAGAKEFTLQVPVSAGATAIDVVSTGPDGEQIVSRRSVSPTPWFVAPGKLEYAVAAGHCTGDASSTSIVVKTAAGDRSASCDWAGGADLRYGLRNEWVLRAGVDAATYPGVDRSFIPTPYVGLGGVIGRRLSLETLFAPYRPAGGPALTSFALRYEPTPSLVLSTSYERSDLVTLIDLATLAQLRTGALPANSVTLDRASHRSSLIQLSPRAWHDRVTLEASEQSQWWNGTVHSGMRTGATIHATGVDLRPYVRADVATSGSQMTGGTAIGAESILMPRGALAQMLGATWLRATMEHGRATIPATELVVGHASSTWRFELGGRRLPASNGWAWTISASPLLQKLQLNSYASGAPNGATTLTQTAHGSAVIDLASRSVTATAESAGDRGGIAGVVFVDLNGNGVRDRGEPVVPHAIVQVANHLVSSEADGRYQVWGLPSLAEVDMMVDSASLSSPWWIPGVAGIHTRVPGNGVGQVDLPVVVAGVVQGKIASDVARLASEVKIEITNLETGAMTTVTPFGDGTFYRDGLRVGRYAVSIDRETLLRRGLESKPSLVTIVADPSAFQGSTVEVELSARRR